MPGLTAFGGTCPRPEAKQGELKCCCQAKSRLGRFFCISNHRIHAGYGTPGILGTFRDALQGGRRSDVISLLADVSRFGKVLKKLDFG